MKDILHKQDFLDEDSRRSLHVEGITELLVEVQGVHAATSSHQEENTTPLARVLFMNVVFWYDVQYQ